VGGRNDATEKIGGKTDPLECRKKAWKGGTLVDQVFPRVDGNATEKKNLTKERMRKLSRGEVENGNVLRHGHHRPKVKKHIVF